MICGGISVIGLNHNINQDWCSSYSDDKVSVIAVSDGVGSKKKSHLGAEKICSIVVDEAKRSNMDEICSEEFLTRIQKMWQDSIGIENIQESCCTVLFCIYIEGKAFLAQLGDGIAGVLNNEETIIFYDDNENHYANETDCLSLTVDTSNWRTRCIEVSGKFGAVLCTDGIIISPDNPSGYKLFVKDFISEYSGMDKTSILSEVKEWLSEWKGNDDKTLAFMIREDGDGNDR